MLEQSGIVEKWDDQKGFGFIVDNTKKKHYFHISAMRGSQRPNTGDEVLFITGTDVKGRLAATHVRHKQLGIDNPDIRTKPSAHNFRFKQQKIPWVILVVLLILPVMAVINLAVRYGVAWGVAVYIFTSLLTYYFYWDDKRRAKRKEWRIPEANLHFWALIGGWPGAFIAQQQFRHKTKKISFQLMFWVIVIAHQLLWFDWLFMDGQWLLASLSFGYR